jgi:hypothetical protein
MNTRSVPVLAIVVALGLAPTPALAGSGDVAATHAYIRANYALVQTARTNLGTSEAALTSLLSGVRRECPNAAAESPQDHNSEQLSNEVVLAMRIAATHPDLRAIGNYTRAVKGIRWSNHTLTSTIQSYVSGLKTLATLPAPNLCADIKAWAVGGFHTLSASTIQLDGQFETANQAAGELPALLLAPYARPQERGILRRTSQLEVQLGDAEARAVETYSQIMDALHLNP